jgi:hypothetical protein
MGVEVPELRIPMVDNCTQLEARSDVAAVVPGYTGSTAATPEASGPGAHFA